MSSVGNALGSIVGGIVGFFVGGLQGAVIGANIGGGVGSAIDPPKGPNIDGPRLSDLGAQTSTYGVSSPRVYGRVALMGNMIWLENNKLKEVVRKEEQGGGKGGGSTTTVTTYTYFATFAVEICASEVAAFHKVWIGPDLVYNATSSDPNTIVASGRGTRYFTFYTGSATQDPDPRIQADVGVANASAYRGRCYLVIKDYPLKKLGNSLAAAQVKVEVTSSTAIATFAELNTADFQGIDLAYYFVNYPFNDANGSHKFSLTASDWSAGTHSTIKHEVVGYDGLATVVGEYINPFLGSGFTYPVSPVNGHVMQGKSDVPITALAAKNASTSQLWFGVVGPQADGMQAGTSDAFWDMVDAADLSFYRYGPVDLTAFGGAINAPIFAIRDTYLYVAVTYSTTELKVYKYKVGNSEALIAVSAMINPGATFVGMGFLNEALYFWDGGGDNLYELDVNALTLGSAIDLNTLWSTSDNYHIFSLDYDAIYMATLGRAYKAVDLTGTREQMAVSSWPSGSNANYYNSKVFGQSGLIQEIRYDLSSTKEVITLSYGVASTVDINLSSIVSAEVLQSELLEAGDIDVTALTATIAGYVAPKTTSIRANLGPLQTCFPFDVFQSGYGLKFVPRGTSSVATILAEDLGPVNQWTSEREMDSQLPQKVTISYLDGNRNYDAGSQVVERLNTDAVNQLELDYPIVLSDDEAIRAIEVLLYMYWLERVNQNFTLPPNQRALEPGDVITVVLDDATHIVRLTNITDDKDGTRICFSRPAQASVYASTASGAVATADPGTIINPGLTIVRFVDIPVISEQDQNFPGVVVAMAGTSAQWEGGLLMGTLDEGQTWGTLQGFAGAGTFGAAEDKLLVHNGAVIELGDTLTVQMVAGTLVAITLAQMMALGNYCAYGVDGRWELIRFQNVTDNGDGNYTLDTFVRGDRGTEWATGLHEVGDYFVMLNDPDNSFVRADVDSIGVAITYRAVSAGQDIDDAYDKNFTYSGMNLECYSPVHLNAVRDGALGDLTLVWLRRTRVNSAWRDGVGVSLNEETEAYEIDIMDGATVKRTISVTAETAGYTAAQQTTDFGAPQASITLNLYQLSGVVGRGIALEATV